MAVELFANTPSTTVTSGGTDAPASGTQETWTVASSAEFPVASSSATPPTQFHVGDPQFPSEVIAVTNVSGTTWTVTRGAEGTAPVQHAAGFTVYQVVSAGALGSFTQVLQPSGDETGDTDSAAIDSARGHTILAPGNWYIGAPGLTTSQMWLQGSGPATILNVVSGGAGLTVTGPGQLYVSDAAFAIGSGAYALTVNGAYDAHFWNLYLSGSSAAGGIKINGDDSLEQHWTDIVMRDVGGVGFDYERTTEIYTGSLYLDRVRIITPPAGAKGFKFNSTSDGASLNTVFMTDCVADAFLEDAYIADNVAQVFATNCWFAVGSEAAAGSAPMRITGGFQHTYNGCYTYTGLADGLDVVIAGSPNGVFIGGGHVFDGSSGNTAIGLSGASLSGGSFVLGQYLNYCGTLTDTPAALSYGGQVIAAPVLWTNSGGGSSQAIAIFDAANPSAALKFIRNGDGQLQIVNGAYSATILALTDAGELQVASLAPQSGALPVNGPMQVSGNLTVTADGTAVKVVSTGSSQYDGPGLFLYNSASSLGNQGGVALQAGIANSGASEGYVTIAQVDHTGAFVSNLVTIDLNGGTFSLADTLVLADAKNIQVGSTTGTQIGTGTGQKLAFYGGTPGGQPDTTGTTTGFTSGSGSDVLSGSTFTGDTGSTAYTIGDIVNALKTLGLLAS